MACLFPVGCYRKDGSLAIRPCGMCKKCRIETSKEWAVRIYHESKMHKKNCFLSLTFNDEHLPEDGSISKKDVQLFIRRFRHFLSPHEVRFYACGEYGDKEFRPHYHCCIFGYDFPDKEQHFWKSTGKNSGYWIYTSKKLSDLWPFGFSTLSDLTIESAIYIARYVRKKITGNSEHAKEIKKSRYGDKLPEFALMSRKPGIGFSWFEEYGNDIYPKDYLTINGIRVKPPRYYDTLYAKKNPLEFDTIKKARLDRTELAFPDEWESINRNRYYENLTKNIVREI
jgi:hypothetical protein